MGAESWLCGSLVPRAGDTSVILGFSQQNVNVWGLSVVPVSHGNMGTQLPSPGIAAAPL